MITVTMPVLKQCPYVDELDAGRLSITFAEDAPELHNLAAQVRKLCAEPVTHEDFTRSVADMLGGDALVVTTWNTGPWSVEVREGPGVGDGDQVVREPDQISEAGHA